MSLPAGSDDSPGRQQADPVAQTFFELLSRLHQEEYTGQIVLHVSRGVPKKAEFPQQIVPGVQIPLR